VTCEEVELVASHDCGRLPGAKLCATFGAPQQQESRGTCAFVATYAQMSALPKKKSSETEAHTAHTLGSLVSHRIKH